VFCRITREHKLKPHVFCRITREHNLKPLVFYLISHVKNHKIQGDFHESCVDILTADAADFADLR
jgi:hypothetical protein